ncbi:MAG: response regulator [Planctomycetes bacterium]|nr:response regulator [Planctomycetota bacterium]
MGTNEFVEMCLNGGLPDPKTISVINLTEDIWETYRDTVGSLLAELEAAAMALESGQNVDEQEALIRRLLHSIKGDSGMAGLEDVHDLCHEAESAFEEVSDLSVSSDMILKIKDWIDAVIDCIANGDLAAEKLQQLEGIKEKDKLKALIIDDDRVCREMLQSILQDFFDCTFAVNGREGLEAYIESRQQNDPYKFITLDINMPEMNGHETLEAIRKWEDANGIEGLDGVKIIMTTSEGSSEHIMSSFRQGCEAYVTKSNMGEKLLDEIAKLGLLKVVKVQKDYEVY